MIVTVTMNPSIDLAYFINHFQLGKMNRFDSPTKSVGGKGINAGRTAALSGSEVVLTGFLAGDIGDLVERYLEAENLFKLDMIPTSGETRNAITIMHDNNTHTEIVESGPEISDNEVYQLLEKLKKLYQHEQLKVICISGSINSKNEQIYLEMLTYIREHIDQNIPVFMDISGKQLLSLLKNSHYKPSFIKPNVHELGEILQKEIKTKKQAYKELSHPYFSGIDYMMISCGNEGALCKVGSDIYDITIPAIDIVNTTGSGDASVGGFAHAVEHNFSLENIFKYSMACGMSNAQHGEVGFINKADTEQFMQQIQVKKLLLS
ncbi:1-phosphofructokinase family hexose kinase [Enterococcus saccharolyticus]|uniref:1-phosphofructokinase family hexose kinase n=1 Tax=Enterococcus TaxID=1350 RepID=UPI001E649ABD|nr:1-phosphofructokinase family hexose kinase [Enterococcus saccharolyticus]MCD5003432.1 1-phosphofructokinase family hexose kinase [Enterococcus saccharolyticus]